MACSKVFDQPPCFIRNCGMQITRAPRRGEFCSIRQVACRKNGSRELNLLCDIYITSIRTLSNAYLVQGIWRGDRRKPYRRSGAEAVVYPSQSKATVAENQLVAALLAMANRTKKFMEHVKL